MADRFKILKVTPVRRRARRLERELQEALDLHWDISEPTDWPTRNLLDRYDVPDWAHGVKVESAGPFSHAVVATEQRGH